MKFLICSGRVYSQMRNGRMNPPASTAEDWIENVYRDEKWKIFKILACRSQLMTVMGFQREYKLYRGFEGTYLSKHLDNKFVAARFAINTAPK